MLVGISILESSEVIFRSSLLNAKTLTSRNLHDGNATNPSKMRKYDVYDDPRHRFAFCSDEG